MNASKEQCDKITQRWKVYSDGQMSPTSESEFRKDMNTFLDKVRKKLPSEASIARDRTRNRRGKYGKLIDDVHLNESVITTEGEKRAEQRVD